MGTVAKRIGELLVEAGVLSQSQLEQALFAQRKDGRKLGQLLVELGLVSEIQLTQTLSRQLSVPWVSLYHVDFSRSLLNLVSREIAEKYALVPIFVRRVRKQGETLYVAMDDPTNEGAIEEVARTAGLPVKPMIASPSDIRAAIRVYYLGETAAPAGAAAGGNDAPPSSATPGPSPVAAAAPSAPKPTPVELRARTQASHPRAVPDSQGPKPPPSRDEGRPRREPVLEAVPKSAKATGRDGPAPEANGNKAAPSEAAPQSAEPSGDSADAAPEIEATEREVTAPPKRARARMISLTLLDGTTIAVPAPGSKPKPEPTERPTEPMSEQPTVSDQLTARDLVSALRAVAHGADASEILGTEPHWEAMFSALLSILLRKGLIADWEFIEEFRKI
jgi:type IV pilus assembly protein PilB